MTQQDKQLLLQDLCARLPYGVMVNIEGYNTSRLLGIDNGSVTTDRGINYPQRLVKPYLRPMSSMTEEENKICDDFVYKEESYLAYYDWLIAHHFDYRGLIEKGLALEAPEGMYKF